MSAEYVDNTPAGDGGAPVVTLDIPTQEAQPAISTDASEDKSAQVSEEQVGAQGEQVEKPIAEAAAAEKTDEVDVETKPPEEKAAHWRGEYFKNKQASETRIAELEQQALEANATPAFLKLDKPPGEWDPKEQLKEMPSAYADKLRSHGFWETLPNIIENLDTQPAEVQNAIYETMNRVFQKQTGVTFEEMTSRLEGQPAASAQTNQPHADLVQKLEAEGYPDDDPAMQAAKWAAAQEGRLRQLEASQGASARQQETFAQQQQAASKQQAEAAFESKKSTVWDNALKTFEGKVPQGKEFMLDFIRARAEKLVASDAIAAGYLDKVEGFLLAATTPAERDQYEKLAKGSLVAYNAKVAVAVQQAAKHLLGEAAEKEHLRSTVASQQMTRRDITPGQSPAPSGSREEILKTPINGNSDIAGEMAAAIYRSRKAS